MQKKSSLLGSAAFGVLIAVGMSTVASAAAAPAADAPVKKHVHARHHEVAAPVVPSASAEEVRALTSQVQDLTARLQQQEQVTQAVQAQAQQAQAAAQAAQASARAAQDQLRAQIETIPGQVKTEIAAEKPKDGKAHYKGVALTLGGFAEAAGIYRSRNESADISSSFAKIPFANSVSSHFDEFRGTARQSRYSLLAEGDINPATRASFYGEFDFQAGPQTGNSNESNSYSPRIRNLYGTLDWNDAGWHLLVGQNWSLVTLNSKGITPRNEVTPPGIEAQYVPGFDWTRQPQIRIAKDFADKQFWAAVSLENPQTTFASAATGTTGTSVSGLTVTTNGGTPAGGFDTANTLSLNHVPDVVGKLVFEPKFGGSQPLHLEILGLYRSYYDRVNVTSASNLLSLPVGVNNVSTTGGGFGAGATLTVVPKLLDVEASVLTGRGIGRYGSGQLPDTVVGANGALKPIPETMFLVGGTLHATPAIDLYLFGGEEQQGRVYSVIGANSYGFGSPYATLANCSLEVGGAANVPSCTTDIQLMTQITGGVWDKIYQGSYGSVRIGLQYSYTTLTGFTGAAGSPSVPGAGPAPKTNESMIFTSFRYYPF